MPAYRGAWVAVLTAALAAGCGRPHPTRPAGTGAEAAAKEFYEALLRQDADAAYLLLDPDSQAACGPLRFARLASAYHEGFGFRPEAVHVRSCDEQGAAAVAHVVFIGPPGSGRHSYNDAVTLRETGGVWRVVLPAGFGRGR